MSQAGRANIGAITFEQLISLNDEMAALVRAGIPLEGGLGVLGQDLPGRPGKLAALLAQRMIGGESLPQILASEPETFPPVWRAVVEAGLRSGYLAAALEAMSATARRMAELRKTIGAALFYPLMVMVLAYATFVFSVLHLAPAAWRGCKELTGYSDPFSAGLVWLGETAHWWAPGLPLLVAVLLAAWWHRSARAAPSFVPAKGRAWRGRWFSLRSVMQTVRRSECMAAFSEILSLLVKHQVPLHQALSLAAEASGDRAIGEASQHLAERLQRGEVLAGRQDLPAGFPPLLGWVLMCRVQHAELSLLLSRAAAGYRERAARNALWTAMYLPIAMTVFLGGTATLLQGLVVFVPLSQLWYALGWPV